MSIKSKILSKISLGFKGIKSDKTVKKSFCLEHALKLPLIFKVQITCVTSRKKVIELILFALNNFIG